LPSSFLNPPAQACCSAGGAARLARAACHVSECERLGVFNVRLHSMMAKPCAKGNAAFCLLRNVTPPPIG